MNTFFKRLPLPGKLILIGIVPLVFVIYLSFSIYHEKKEKLNLLGDYLHHIKKSAEITTLIDELQTELKLSFEFLMKKTGNVELIKQRKRTDSCINQLKTRADSSLNGFTSYTFIDDMMKIRPLIDSAHTRTDIVMSAYINAIFRLNTLTVVPAVKTDYLEPVYSDLIDQKLLSQLVIFMGIMRSNIYNVLYTHENGLGTLYGLRGVYDIYNSYEKEFLIKASATSLNAYKDIRRNSSLKNTSDYIDTLFRKYAFDSSYNAADWWLISSLSIDGLRTLQLGILKDAEKRMNNIYESEETEKRSTLIFLIVTIIVAIAIVAYSIHIITLSLTEMKIAAQKISRGVTGLRLSKTSNDALGSLAQSISEIDENNKLLTEAAHAIGKGNFAVTVHPRSPEDLLGNAIVDMKNELQQFTQQLQLKQQQIAKAVLNAQEKERTEIGGELHDNVNQLLATVKMYLRMLAENKGEKEELLVKSIEYLTIAMKEIRKLSNTLILPSLKGQSLKESIEELVRDLSMGSSLDIHLDIKNINEDSLIMEQKVAVYRILQEQLNNILKHAEASSVNIQLQDDDGMIILVITDNGKGFDLNARRKGVGISNIINRTKLLNGKAEIDSAPGKGCRLSVSFTAREILLKEPES